MRTRRTLVTQLMGKLGIDVPALAAAPPGENLSVYDVRHGGRDALPGQKMRGEGDPPVADAAVNQAYDGADLTYRFYQDVLGRNSVDGNGLELTSSVHYSNQFENAFWDGNQMVYGDGGGQLFIEGSLTSAVDVIAHELTHGVTQYTAQLIYSRQPGALNEHFSDVFGSLVKQYGLDQTADQADWLIGPDVVGEELAPALRSMKAPGTANKYDKQPADMSGFVTTTRDNGGVHTNSGIPNRAFYLTASTIGGNAWEVAGRIWYAAMNDARLRPNSRFSSFAQATIRAATTIAGTDSDATKAVTAAWHTVKVL
jgi:Zn-dependent metalloprotease